MKLFNREPAAILAVIQCALALLIAFGTDLSTEQVGAILAVSAAVLGLITRSVVSSPATVEKLNG